MLKTLIQNLFPEGQRKLMVSVVALLIGAALEQFGGGLDETMMTAIIALVAIFTGGNVLEHISAVLAPLKGTKVGKIIEEAIPGDQNLEDSAEPQAEANSGMKFALSAALNDINVLKQNMEVLNQNMNVHAQNSAKLLELINRLSKAPPQQPSMGREL